MALRISIQANTIVFTDTDTSIDYPYNQPFVEARYTDGQVYFIHQIDKPNLYPFASGNNYPKEKLLFTITEVENAQGDTFADKEELQAYLEDTGIGVTIPYQYDVALGVIPNAATWNKFGYNLDIDSGDEEIIASWGGSFDPTTDIMSTAQTFTIDYNNSTDGVGNGGALMLQVYYLDGDFMAQTSIHTLGSTGSDTTSFSGLGINRVVVISNGGDGFNANDITITATTDGTIQAQIPAEQSVTQQCIFHTQINHVFLTDWLLLNAIKLTGGGGSPEITFKAYSWSRVTNTRYEVYRHAIDVQRENSVPILPSQPFVISGREVLYFVAETDTNNTQASLRFSGIETLVV